MDGARSRQRSQSRSRDACPQKSRATRVSVLDRTAIDPRVRPSAHGSDKECARLCARLRRGGSNHLISQANTLRLTYSAMARKAGLAPGKLSPAMMVMLLNALKNHDPSVKLGPALGEDAAAIRLGRDRYLVSKTDPITFSTHRAAPLLLQVNANDLATRGGATALLASCSTVPARDNRRGYQALFRRASGRGKKAAGDNNGWSYRSD
jgi:hypothetical protein